ncbi:MAG TPA: hypothetical protein VKA01_07740 [Vicinamibacteria bacterium]|nr:hypothetical protein [Vicinamibacteria bacterium]
MRKLVIVGSAIFAVCGLAQAPKPSPSPTPAAAPKAAVSPTPSASPGAAKPAAPRNQVLGTVVSVDAAQSTITFKDEKDQTATWKAEGKAANRLKNLKAGDKVKIQYTVDDKGAPAAVAIRPAGKGKKTETTETM